MLTVEHITTRYGKKQVLTGILFEVGKREIVLLMGGNGSGNSTGRELCRVSLRNLCITLHPPLVMLRKVAASTRRLDFATSLRIALQ